MLKTTLYHSGYRILRSLLLCLMLISLLAGTRSTALAQGGKAYAWGGNYQGQLGDGTTTNRNKPVQVSGLTGVTQVAGGGFHSLSVLGAILPLPISK
ncbi:MAG: RCC1 domain-containing protein [Armatimonadetes bacterium]|nr:RCC1 domain-containing protein [Armatimonadota bacterium]